MTTRVQQSWARLKHRRLLRRMAGPRLLQAFAAAYPEAFFVEVGANDGDHHDHLRPIIRSRPWRGIMVEPVPYVFARLRSNYGDLADRIALENAAIAERDGTLPFFHMPEVGPDERASLPPWYDEIGSFAREALLTHAEDIPGLEQRMVETPVPALTFESLCRKHGASHVDLLLIDTEGYDWRIIQSLDLRGRLRPRLLVYEHFHLPPDQRAACREHLEAAGYETLEEGFDTFCLDVSAGDALTATWRRLRPALPGLSKHEGA
jgi:FkbM family methyltransferase